MSNKMTKWLVLSCEHTKGMGEHPVLVGVYDNEQEAQTTVDSKVMLLCDEHDDFENDEVNEVHTFDEAGEPDYGCCFSIQKLEV